MSLLWITTRYNNVGGHAFNVVDHINAHLMSTGWELLLTNDFTARVISNPGQKDNKIDGDCWMFINKTNLKVARH